MQIFADIRRWTSNTGIVDSKYRLFMTIDAGRNYFNLVRIMKYKDDS